VLYRDHLSAAVDRVAALLRGEFPEYARALAAHNVATFSRERLESSLDDVPWHTEAALSYLRERLITLRADIACDDQPLETPCTALDEYDVVAREGSCRPDFFRSFSCADGSLGCNLTCMP
jgi:hypothetical protein